MKNLELHDASVVEYEPKKTLKVHGHDMYKGLNEVLLAWFKDPVSSGSAFGQALGMFFELLQDPEIFRRTQNGIQQDPKQDPAGGVKTEL